ncbi:MAG: EAL domain-containing protein, partial [Chthoniobacterales bacterium]
GMAAFPILNMIFISACLARFFHLRKPLVILLAVSTFVTFLPLKTHFSSTELLITGHLSGLAILLPLWITFLLCLLKKIDIKSDAWRAFVPERVLDVFAQTPMFLLGYLITVGMLALIFYSGVLESAVVSFAAFLHDLPHQLALTLRVFCNQLLWCVGVHGSKTLEALFPPASCDNLLFGTLTHREFMTAYSVFGGAGAGLGLLIAIFLSAKDRHSRAVAKASAPFSIFNIGEIFVYGLPTAFNPHFVVPFILAPVLSTNIAYTLLSIFNIQFPEESVTWITPAIWNTYLLSDGNLGAVLIQILVIVFSVMLYMPFVKAYSRSILKVEKLEQGFISNKFGLVGNVESTLAFQHSQSHVVEINRRLNRILEAIEKDAFTIHYQPIVDIKNWRVASYEVLLRPLSDKCNIEIREIFSVLEECKMVPLLDRWVCARLAEDLKNLKSKGCEISCSINIHPDTLLFRDDLRMIRKLLGGFNVRVEMVERGFSKNQIILKHIQELIRSGMLVVMDDFGAGESNLSRLADIPVSDIKIDRNLLLASEQPAGELVFQQACKICMLLGKGVVVEGVETQEQLARVMQTGVSMIQGWYFSRALPLQEAIEYRPDAELRIDETEISLD